jgi:hypothetical protein
MTCGTTYVCSINCAQEVTAIFIFDASDISCKAKDFVKKLQSKSYTEDVGTFVW